MLFSIFITQIKTTLYFKEVVYLPKLIWMNVMTKVIAVAAFFDIGICVFV